MVEEPRDRYRAANVSAFPIGGRSLVWSRESGRVIQVDTLLTWILHLVRGVRTIDEHAAAIASAGSSNDPAELKPLLAALRDAALLRGFNLDRLPPPPASVAQAEITTVAVITADRPAALRRSIQSIADQCDAYGHHPRLLVVDGSNDPENQLATRKAVTALGETRPLTCKYIGITEAERYRKSLAARGVDVPSLKPGAIGANRNLVLLLTAGEHILCVDDDVVCTTWAPQAETTSLAVTGNHLPFRETTFFTSRSAALASVTESPIDLLSAHARLLNCPISVLIAKSEQPPDLTQACGHLLSGLLDGSSHVVRATFAGLVGDDGGYCPHRRLFASEAIRDRLWSSPGVFHTSMTSREVIKVATTTVATHDANFQAFCMGLSNQTVVPPFMPDGRYEDGVFGALLSACEPAAAFGHLPIGIVHASDRPSERTGTPMLSATETRIGDFLSDLVRGLNPSLTGPSPTRMQRIGEKLVDIGTLTIRELADLVTVTTLETRSREFEEAGRAAENPVCPDYWRAALDEYRSQFLEHVVRRDFFLPIEFHGVGSVDAGYQVLGKFLKDFGELMVAWPAIWQAAREVNHLRRE